MNASLKNPMPISLREVVDLISDGYLVVDKDFCIIEYNKALLRLCPASKHINIGADMSTYIDKCFSGLTSSQMAELCEQAAEKKETVTAEAIIAGDTNLSVEITPIIHDDDHVGSIILLKDITQSKQLIESTKAESRYKSAFLANMSHEIRTPMNAIIGMVSIGKAAADIDRKDYCLTRIEDASKHLLGVINDVLDLSKIEAGKFEISPEEFVFNELMDRIINVIKFRADEKSQILEVNIDENIPNVIFGDNQRLAQIITNLIGNAVKFTPAKGTISLDAQLLGEEDGVCVVLFKVADNGIGISPEQQLRLFKSFSQAETDTTRKFGGTGLGLSISKNIVTLMGGLIWGESELGKGSTFSFTVQMKRTDETTQNGKGMPRLDAEEAALDGTGLFAGRHVLLAEDVEINREIVLVLLEPTGLEIECAVNGAEAVRMYSIAPEKYEMIFMDVQMPVMNGFEATRAIRALDTPSSKTIPIIAMTASVFREDIKMCLEAGMDAHIGKPLNFDEILVYLKRYLRSS